MNSFPIILTVSGLKSAVATMFPASLRVLPYSPAAPHTFRAGLVKVGSCRRTVTRGSSRHVLQVLKETLHGASLAGDPGDCLGGGVGIQKEGERPFFFFFSKERPLKELVRTLGLSLKTSVWSFRGTIFLLCKSQLYFISYSWSAV